MNEANEHATNALPILTLESVVARAVGGASFSDIEIDEVTLTKLPLRFPVQLQR